MINLIYNVYYLYLLLLLLLLLFIDVPIVIVMTGIEIYLKPISLKYSGYVIFDKGTNINKSNIILIINHIIPIHTPSDLCDDVIFLKYDIEQNEPVIVPVIIIIVLNKILSITISPFSLKKQQPT
jgi:hypothetical protein